MKENSELRKGKALRLVPVYKRQNRAVSVRDDGGEEGSWEDQICWFNALK